MTITESVDNVPSRRSFLGFRFKTKGSTPKQSFTQPDVSSSYTQSDIPRQAINPAIHPLLAKPVARDENFVLLPIQNGSSKRKRDPNSPVRVSIKPKSQETDTKEWDRYLTSYAEGRFNMSNPPEPPSNRPAGHLKPPIPPNDNERVNALREYYDVVRPTETDSSIPSPTTRSQIDRFQRLVVAARNTFDTKIALLSLVDEKRQFFKCEAGLGMNVETDREITFCGHTILSNEPMVVLDAEKDWRLAANPLVTGWPYVRFYAGAPIITSAGYAIGTVCIIDTEPRESFDVNQRRKLTEFARLAMDEIDLAMSTRRIKDQAEANSNSDPSIAIPDELRGMTAVASEAGTIDTDKAGKNIENAGRALDDFDVVATAVTLEEKDGNAQLKFRYGRNNTAEVEATAKGVEKAARTTGGIRRPEESVKVVYPTYIPRSAHSRGKRPDASSSSYSDRELNGRRHSSPYHSDSGLRPSVRPKSTLRVRSYNAPGYRDTMYSDEYNSRKYDYELNRVSSSLGHYPPSRNKHNISSMNSHTPAMPTFLEMHTKSNTELAAQLIARALRLDFVYFMQITPFDETRPNLSSDPNREINMDIIGTFGLPFKNIVFDAQLHLKALRNDKGVPYDPDSDWGNPVYENMVSTKDYFKFGLLLPVWRQYDRTSLASSTTTSSAKARVGTSAESVSDRGFNDGVSTRGMTTRNLKEKCRSGVVLGVFSNRRSRLSDEEIKYLKQWKSLKGHI